jgi:hypothetical protein
MAYRAVDLKIGNTTSLGRWKKKYIFIFRSAPAGAAVLVAVAIFLREIV